MTESDPALNEMRQAIRQLQTQTKAQTQEIKAAATTGNPVLSLIAVKEHTEEVKRVLPVLSTHQARAFLHQTETTAGVRRRDLLELITPWIDQHHADVWEDFAALYLICGDHGKITIRDAIHAVNRNRRARGAVELAAIDTLLQVMRNKALENEEPFDEEAFVQAAPDVLKAFELEEAGSTVVISGFTLQQLGWLHEIKQYIQQHHPELANVYTGSAEDYYMKVSHLFSAAERNGMGPITYARQIEMKAIARQYPNTQFRDSKGIKTWGGRWQNKKVKTTVYETVPEQGPIAPPSTLRTLTNHGAALLKHYAEIELINKHGFPARAEDIQRNDRLVEAKRQELLVREVKEGEQATWTITEVTLQQLGYAYAEKEIEVDAPDKPHEALFGGQSVGELVVTMQQALREMGLDDSGSNASRLVP